MNWSPIDLPYLRENTSRVLADTAAMWASSGLPAGPSTATAIERFITELDSAPLTWISGDVCQLIEDTHRDVPQWSPAAAMPAPSGLIAFHTSPLAIVWTGGVDGQRRRVPLDAALWHMEGRQVRIRALSRMGEYRAQLSPLRSTIPFDEVFSVLIPVDTPTGEGSNLHTETSPKFDGRAGDGPRLLSVIGTTWLLLSQPAVVESRESAPLKVRGKGRKRRPRLVRVSEKQLTRPPGGGGHGRQGSRGEPVARWWVRGHWRQQPYGEGRALRKPIFIEPHTAGPADAPLDSRPHVQVVRK